MSELGLGFCRVFSAMAATEGGVVGTASFWVLSSMNEADLRHIIFLIGNCAVENRRGKAKWAGKKLGGSKRRFCWNENLFGVNLGALSKRQIK